MPSSEDKSAQGFRTTKQLDASLPGLSWDEQARMVVSRRGARPERGTGWLQHGKHRRLFAVGPAWGWGVFGLAPCGCSESVAPDPPDTSERKHRDGNRG